MFVEKEFMRRNHDLSWGIPYVCGCKSRYYYNYSQLFFGENYGDDYITGKLMIKVRNGDFGDEWKSLAEQYPRGLVNAELHLYICDGCGYWSNEEEMSFYLPDEGGWAERGKSVAFESYRKEAKLIAEYTHRCPECGRMMRDLPGLLDGEYPTYKVDKETIYREHLRCPKCHKRIMLLSSAGSLDIKELVNGDIELYKRYDSKYTGVKERHRAKEWRNMIIKGEIEG